MLTLALIDRQQDNKSAKKGGAGERQFNGLLDVYRKTIASDGIAGLYRGFLPSVVGIIVYRGLYFGMYDSLKPVVLQGSLKGNFLASFLLGWGVTTGAGIASYPLDTIRRRMMMTSGEKVHYNVRPPSSPLPLPGPRWTFADSSFFFQTCRVCSTADVKSLRLK